MKISGIMKIKALGEGNFRFCKPQKITCNYSQLESAWILFLQTASYPFVQLKKIQCLSSWKRHSLDRTLIWLCEWYENIMIFGDFLEWFCGCLIFLGLVFTYNRWELVDLLIFSKLLDKIILWHLLYECIRRS